MAVGRPGKFGAPAVPPVAEDRKHACATVTDQVQPMTAQTVQAVVLSLSPVTTMAAQVIQC